MIKDEIAEEMGVDIFCKGCRLDPHCCICSMEKVYKVFQVCDEEYSYIVCAKNRYFASKVYCDMCNLDLRFDSPKLKVKELPKLQWHIRPEDYDTVLLEDIGSEDEKYWRDKIYREGGYYFFYEDEYQSREVIIDKDDTDTTIHQQENENFYTKLPL